MTEEALMLLRQIAADMRAIAAAAHKQAQLFEPEAIATVLRAIASDVRSLRAGVDPDVGEIADLFRVIAVAFRDAPFTLAELFARTDAPPWPWTPRKLGKLFSRIEGREFEGWCVRRLGEEAAGTIWRLERVCRT